MCGCWQYILPMLPFSFSEKENLGIRQISAYVDALSNPFTQSCSQVTIDVNTFNNGRTFHSYSQLSWTHASSELVVPELSHSDIASYWGIVNYQLTWYSQACVVAWQSVICSTFKNISQAKAREPGVTPYSSSNGGLHGMHCSGQLIYYVSSLSHITWRTSMH